MRPQTVHCYEYLDRPYDNVRMLFAEEMLTIIESAVNAAKERALTIAQSTELHASVAGVDIHVPVEIDVCTFEQSDLGEEHQMCRLHLQWHAKKGAALMPHMKGDLIAHPVGESETQIAFFGDYRPPLGILGSAADTLFLHRIAEASVHRFINEIVERVRDQIPEDAY